jgi:hypothetical protein
MIEGFGTIYYFRKYIEDENFPVPDAHMERICEIIKFIQTRNETRSAFGKRMNIPPGSLRRMTNFYNSHR